MSSSFDRKASLRKTQRNTANADNIDIRGLQPFDPQQIHLLPVPKSLGQLLPQNSSADSSVSRATASPSESAKDTPSSVSPSVNLSRIEFEAFKQEVDAKIDIRNAEMITLRSRVLAMEANILSIRTSMRRTKALVIGGSLFVVGWSLLVHLFL